MIELLSFIGFSIFLWLRDVDTSGAIQTTELKWINIAILSNCLFNPFSHTTHMFNHQFDFQKQTKSIIHKNRIKNITRKYSFSLVSNPF